jgi:hypothetical protein
MAEKPDDKDRQKEDILLVARVKAFLLNGDSIDLLPFKHEEDVRAEVNKFIEDWAKTGFLLKGSFLYPWHQVKMLEVVSVSALTHAQAPPYLEDWRKDTEAQKAFWKTRKSQAKQDEEKEENGGH